MGLDISIGVNNREEIFSPEYHSEENDFFHKHNLSRTFCNFICRRGVIEGEAELDQIGKLTGIDISPIYQMEKYWDEENVEDQLSMTNSEEEKKRMMERIQEDNDSLTGNIDRVLHTINLLIQNLTLIDNLPDLLSDNDYDTLDNTYYFSDFNIDRGDGYIDNNFGQDLRNFKRFLEYAKERGTTTVYFVYG